MDQWDWLEGDEEGIGEKASVLGDYDLEMSRRDREKYEDAIANQAVLHTMEEMAGEFYLAVYRETMKTAAREAAESWGVRL